MRKYYKAYFTQKAIENPDLAHTPEETSFYFVKDIYNPDAFDNAIRSVGKTPCMLLENYRAKVGDSNSRNNFKQIIGRFNILVKGDAGEEQSIDDAYSLAESIAEDILKQIRDDLQEGAPIVISDQDESAKVFFPFQEIEMDPIGPISNDYYGVSVSFMLKTPAR